MVNGSYINIRWIPKNICLTHQKQYYQYKLFDKVDGQSPLPTSIENLIQIVSSKICFTQSFKSKRKKIIKSNVFHYNQIKNVNKFQCPQDKFHTDQHQSCRKQNGSKCILSNHYAINQTRNEKAGAQLAEDFLRLWKDMLHSLNQFLEGFL